MLDLHASFRSGLLALANPGGMRMGFADAKELNTLFQHERIKPSSGRTHAVDKNLAFAERLGCGRSARGFSRVHRGSMHARRFAVSSKTQEFTNQSGWYTQIPLPVGRRNSGLWTPGLNSRTCLIEQAGAVVVFSGSPADVPYISMIREQMKNEPLIAAGKLSLSEATALIEASDVYVGVDSGPMHIAAFTGTRIVALFGPTDPAKVGPYGSGHTVIRRTDLDCLACRKRSCSNRQCLEGISPQTVFEETVRLLGWNTGAQGQ